MGGHSGHAAKGDTIGTRWLIEVLLAHRAHPTQALIAAMDELWPPALWTRTW